MLSQLQAPRTQIQRRDRLVDFNIWMIGESGDQCRDGLAIVRLTIAWQQKRCVHRTTNGWLDGWKPVETYIDQQFDQYYKDESGLNRKNIKDNRVHCCLYFISPFGHG